uniref:Uncharacterized protein n=1 Tax=Arundo donax TaxID=35708 RepID=A0A0A9CV03_ARUDO
MRISFHSGVSNLFDPLPSPLRMCRYSSL